MARIPKGCPFPTIVKRALKNLHFKEKSLSYSAKKLEEIKGLEIINEMLLKSNEELQARNIELSNKVKELERKILLLQEDNAILRNLVRRLKNKLKDKRLC
ncbi:MAG: hypothetical protein QXL86_03175 [Candidatus Aenigmatarchaeota archaeon]